MKDKETPYTIAILGGTGALGTGLASRWYQAGHRIVIGSRTLDKAQDAVNELHKLIKGRGAPVPKSGQLVAAENPKAAQQADIAVLTVPFAHQRDTLDGLGSNLQGKILIDVTVPLVPPAVGKVQLPPEGSAAMVAQTVLGERVRVVSAFQNVAAHHLQAEGDIDCDVLVSADDNEAAQTVLGLVAQAGMRGFHAGPLANAVVAEALTSVLIQLNKQHRTHSGIRITGIGD